MNSYTLSEEESFNYDNGDTTQVNKLFFLFDEVYHADGYVICSRLCGQGEEETFVIL